MSSNMTCKELKMLAKHNGLKGYSKLNKKQLVKFCMRSLRYAEDGSVEDFDAEFEGKPIFRKYLYYSGQSDEIAIASILKKHPHPNIVDIYDIQPDYVDEELLNTRITYSDVKAFIPALRRAKDYLHSLGIVYLDWKLDNLGMSNKGVVKIFDFDMSRKFSNGKIIQSPGRPKGYLWRNAESIGLTDPIEIDDWIFLQMIMKV